MSQSFTLIQMYHEIIKAYHKIIQVPPPKILIKSANRVIKLVKIISNLRGEKKTSETAQHKGPSRGAASLGFRRDHGAPGDTAFGEVGEGEGAGV